MTNNSLNSYGVPLHACNGYKQDEHYWAYIGEKNRIDKINGVGLYDPRRLWVNIKAKEQEYVLKKQHKSKTYGSA